MPTMPGIVFASIFNHGHHVAAVVSIVGKVRTVVAEEVAREHRDEDADVPGVRIGLSDSREASPQGDARVQVKRRFAIPGAARVIGAAARHADR